MNSLDCRLIGKFHVCFSPFGNTLNTSFVKESSEVRVVNAQITLIVQRPAVVIAAVAVYLPLLLSSLALEQALGKG